MNNRNRFDTSVRHLGFRQSCPAEPTRHWHWLSMASLYISNMSDKALVAGSVRNKSTASPLPFISQRTKALAFIIFTLLLTLLGNTGQLFGQNVSAQISSREAWVGSPIVLQIQISNANQYSLPESITIDGCDVRAAGSPSQSSRITIYNGRRSESRSVTMRYLITPQREGDFQIPKLQIDVDGKPQTTQPMQFVATKSETGDLLFVEVEGKKEKVYVGQPLELKLKLWIKPFSDRERRIKLNEGHMWQMISDQTSWGSFSDRMQQLNENRQRPEGRTVLRKDTDGRDREYYLYEIEATVYPNKPGEIDASDLQVVVNYPQALARSRDPFDSFFGNGGRSSMIKEMMGDDFFGGPFGRRLSVSDVRPIVAEANVDATEVLAVPTANRPADYRGAVGKYQIVAQAEPTSVAAGDPITLKIGIIGDGPMELVQAPPLHQIKSLTDGFQITDQSLAGFVQDETKIFVTTIRPHNEDVKQIPPIPLSFFNPDKESYETAFTTPISIEVEKAESLDMNSIVSDIASANASVGTNANSSANTAIGSSALPVLNLQNDFSSSLVNSGSPKSSQWWYFFVVPPICWLVIASGRTAMAVFAGLGALKSAKSTALAKIKSANEAPEFADALREYVAGRTKSSCPTFRHAVGQLRERHAYDLAARLESFCEKRMSNAADVEQLPQQEIIDEYRHGALDLLELIDAALTNARQKPKSKAGSKKRGTRRPGATASMIGLAILCTGSTGLASEESLTEKLPTILAEANSTYRAAEELVDSDLAKARDMFAASAERYQLLVDEGVQNTKLFLNLGNAWYRSGEQNKAILNYHRALWMDQGNLVALQNLRSIERRQSTGSEEEPAAPSEFDFSLAAAGRLLADICSFIGQRTIRFAFAISSVIFWVLLSCKTVRPRAKILRWSVFPLLLAIASGAAIYQSENSNLSLAIVVDDEVELKSGDGEEFHTTARFKAMAGKVATIIDQRAEWNKVRLPDGQIGWLSENQLERVAPLSDDNSE